MYQLGFVLKAPSRMQSLNAIHPQVVGNVTGMVRVGILQLKNSLIFKNFKHKKVLMFTAPDNGAVF